MVSFLLYFPIVGRPTKYNEDMLQKAQEYVQKCEGEYRMPFVEEMALKLGINDDTVVEWAKEHEEFSATLRRLKTLQKLHLKRGALEKRLQCNVAIFLLKANHGLDDKDNPEPVIPPSLTVHFVGADGKPVEGPSYNRSVPMKK